MHVCSYLIYLISLLTFNTHYLQQKHQKTLRQCAKNSDVKICPSLFLRLLYMLAMATADMNGENISISSLDQHTPDDWIARHPGLIRLTGPHPLNAEPHLDVLLKQGFTTPSPLHYVRNHGRVPKIEAADHQLLIDGLVSKSTSLSLEEIKKMPSIRIPVTLSCDGNRRKEFNMLRHTKGFGWGAGAISTSVWKGVPLRYLIESVCEGVKVTSDRNTDQPLFVCFEGSQKEELKKGVYGTR